MIAPVVSAIGGFAAGVGISAAIAAARSSRRLRSSANPDAPAGPQCADRSAEIAAHVAAVRLGLRHYADFLAGSDVRLREILRQFELGGSS